MSKTVRFLSVAALLSSASLVWAQEPAQDNTEQPQDTAQEETPAADGNNTDGLSTGTPVETEPQVGQTYVAEKFQDWELRCVVAADDNDPCQLYQLLRDGQGTAVAEFSLFNLPEGGQAIAGATVITPLETLLTAEMRLAVDTGKAKRYPYSFCSTVGCFSRVGFTAEEVAQFKKGSVAKVTIVPAAAPNDTVDLTVSLAGFTDGWNAVIAANADNQ